tara:strand:- start:447 stop:788 length:342 start_codon:yes stop_codon:yes gene_type:complete
MLFKPFWPVVAYVVNYDYIVNVLCENKDKPELQCDGKCYLMTKLAQETEQQKENPFGKKQSNTEIQNIVFYHINSDYNLISPIVYGDTKIFKVPVVFKSGLFSQDISNPPEFI